VTDDHRMCLRLKAEDLARIADLQTVLPGTTPSSVMRECLARTHEAYRVAGSLRPEAREQANRQLRLFKPPAKAGRK
jgi:hypothetical protein